MSYNKGGRSRPPYLLNPPYEAIKWGYRKFWVLDQRLLPHKKKYLELSDIESACIAIKSLAVRGAPLIGVCAALALAHAARSGASKKILLKSAEKLASTRPTAVNLFNVLREIKKVINEDSSCNAIVTKALNIWKEEEERSYAMVEHAQGLVGKGARITTYCNTGMLAGPGLGTALGVLIKAHLEGKKIDVVVPETRPLLQGARLTSWELTQWKIPHILVTESALASVLNSIDACFVGADRIAKNGDTANKVGTYGLAILCRSFGVPFYVVAPTSTVDAGARKGAEIPIEIRDASEVAEFNSCRSAPRGAKAFNPAFDVTPAELITAIITEEGVARPPYRKNLPL